jgi:hypothetical protein
VLHTLDPLVYVGPAEGLPQEEWQLRTAAEILDLKICDMAMGSGAFLVQSCRYLSDKLVEAWDNAERTLSSNGEQYKPQITPEGHPSQGHPDEELLPNDTDERLALARRLVSERCLYGVDKNPMAVEMAKLSLWLITLAKNKPFTFLDHALRSGDSLLGADLEQIKNLSMDKKAVRQTTYMDWPMKKAIDISLSLREKIRLIPDNDVSRVQDKERLLKEANEATELIKLGADLIIASALSEARQREQLSGSLLYDYEILVSKYHDIREKKLTEKVRDEAQELLNQIRANLNQQLKGRDPFH